MCRSEARCGASTSVQPNLQDDSDIQQTGSQASPAGESAAAAEYRGSPYDAQQRSLFFSLSALVSASADTVMLHMFACPQSWQLLSHHITSHHITSHHITCALRALDKRASLCAGAQLTKSPGGGGEGSQEGSKQPVPSLTPHRKPAHRTAALRSSWSHPTSVSIVPSLICILSARML